MIRIVCQSHFELNIEASMCLQALAYFPSLLLLFDLSRSVFIFLLLAGAYFPLSTTHLPFGLLPSDLLYIADCSFFSVFDVFQHHFGSKSVMLLHWLCPHFNSRAVSGHSEPTCLPRIKHRTPSLISKWLSGVSLWERFRHLIHVYVCTNLRTLNDLSNRNVKDTSAFLCQNAPWCFLKL